MNLISRRSADATDYYYTDYHGSVVRCGEAEYSYGAFVVQKNQNGDPNPMRYCGEYYDTETGLIYLRNRYYDPSIGRFITEDPAKDGLNWYVYCSNNPVNYIDPSGLIREAGYNKHGYWSDNPDRDDFGEDSLIYSSLVTLGNMWNLRPDNRWDIEELASKVREIGGQFGIEGKIRIAQTIAPSSANATDVVLMAGDMDKAAMAATHMKAAQYYARNLYGKDSDGSQQNALKHTMWNALMTKRFGAEYAKTIANSHEFGANENMDMSKKQQDLMNMDLWNNSQGRILGETFEKSHWHRNYNYELAWEIAQMINNKTIWVVNWVD